MPNIRRRSLFLLLFVGILSPWLAARPGWAQLQLQIHHGAVPFNVLVAGNQAQLELTPAQIESIPGTTQTRLEQVRALVAAGEWDEAIDTLLDLMAEPTDGLVELSSDRYVTLREYCQLQIAQLPPAALERYRGRVDAVAESWYRDGVARRDGRLLARVVDEMFASSWGDDALWALGEMALEAADYQAARRHWERISPRLRSPAGRAEWFALAGVDVPQHWPDVDRAWQARDAPPDWLAYPDTNLDLAAVRARLALVSVREGNLDRAKFELDLLRRRHADATGRLGGKSQQLSAALQGLIEGAATWPPVAATENSSGPPPREFTAAWEAPVSYVPSTTEVRRTFDDAGQAPVMPTDLPLRYHPVVADGVVLYSGSRTVRAVKLATGRPAITENGLLYRSDILELNSSRRSGPPGFFVGGGVVAGEVHYTLTVAGGIAYGRIGSVVTSRLMQDNVGITLPSDQALVGLDLGREGLLAFKAEPEDGTWSFEGPPECDGQSLYVAMRHSDVKPRAVVACYDLASGQLRWRTPVCAADTPASGQGAEVSNGRLTLVGDTIFFNTNLGAVAAVDKEDGRTRWVRRYDRASAGVADRRADHFRRELAPCVVAEGVVMAAPADTPLVFALDANTGKTLWVNEDAGDAIDLLGVSGGNLIATGDRCRGIDVCTGRVRFVWPESPMAGIVGRGRGCLAGNEIFWPTRREIYVLDAATGAPTRPPIDISVYTENGANLDTAGGYLLVAADDKMIALGPTAAPPPAKQAQPAETTLGYVIDPLQ